MTDVHSPPATFSISLADHAPPETVHPACYFETEILDEVIIRMASSGYDIVSKPEDKSWGWREADIRDPAGNMIRLYWADKYRRFPPWRVVSEETA